MIHHARLFIVMMRNITRIESMTIKTNDVITSIYKMVDFIIVGNWFFFVVINFFVNVLQGHNISYKR